MAARTIAEPQPIMPESIFLSWTASDEESVTRIHDRLVAEGFTVWNYRDHMRAGDDIPEQVIEAIQTAHAAIFCLSDAALQAPWMADELAWCKQNLVSTDRRMRAMLPVQVGPLRERVPSQLQRWGDPFVEDLSTGDEGALQRIVQKLRSTLGRKAPIPIAAALFAMTSEQCEELLQSPPEVRMLEDLCRNAGMSPASPFIRGLANRYGDRPEKFAPFSSDRTLTQEIHDAVERTNSARTVQGLQPISLVWVTHEFSRPGGANLDVRRFWRDRPSLLVADSVSVLHPGVKQYLDNVPESHQRSVVLWVPPYTRHSICWETHISKALEPPYPKFGDLADDWIRDAVPDKYEVAFDVGTLASLRPWLRRAFGDLTTEAPPQPQVVSDFRARYGRSTIGPAAFYDDGDA